MKRALLVALVVVVPLTGLGRPSRVRRDKKTGLEFVRLSGGRFHLGCEPGDTQCYADEKPGREVVVKPFWLGRTDTTVDAYAKCVAAGACTAPMTGGSCNWHVEGRGSHPINCIDWHQAGAFCAWLGLRLPTEEEWEFAAKGGTDRIYPWGDEPVTAKRADFCDVRCYEAHKDWTWTDQTQDDGWASTAPVGSYPAGASKDGLLDLAGNAQQWTSTDAGAGTRVIKGGAWDLYVRYLRASTRARVPADRWFDNVTVRCAG